MTTNYHTPISEGSPADAQTFNDPLGQMDAALTEALLEERDGHIIQDEGVDLPQQPRLDFQGAGVEVTNEVGKTVVTITSGGVTDHGGLTGLGDDDHPQYLLKSGLREWDEQGSDPSTPATGKWKLYFKAGGLYLIDDAGVVIGPIVSDHGALSGLGDDDHPQYMQKGTSIEGMELIWNSANSLSVGTGVCYAENGDRINVTSVLTASSLSLSNSTWYHVYAYLSGSPAMEVVTTAPVAWKGTAYSKTGDTSRRYIGSVKTDGSGNIYNFEHDPKNNHIIYRKQNFGASPFRCLSSGTATSATSVSLAGVIPVTGKFSWLRCSNSSDQLAYYGVATLTSSAFQLVFAAGNTAQQSSMTFMPMDASQVVYYLLGAAAGAGGANIDVYGYTYKR